MLLRPSVKAFAPGARLFPECHKSLRLQAARGPLLGQRPFGTRVRGVREKGAEGVEEDLSHNPEWGHPDDLRKLKVALHVGYDGHGYRGLQINRENAIGETVEHFLEQSLFKVGGIRPSNMGDLTKIGWSRASRTDKGVHSLCSVVALKMLCPEDGATFEADPEGNRLADAMNAHLPKNIRVFSCQRVVKSFRGRQQAADRKYEYYLPASVIGVSGEDPEEDSRRLELMRNTLLMFEGTHAFHNFTSASLYGKKKNDYRKGRRPVWRRPQPSQEVQDSGDQQENTYKLYDDPEVTFTPDTSAAAAPLRTEEEHAEPVTGNSSTDGSDYVPMQWDRFVNLEWNDDLARQLGSPHYRHMRKLAVSDPVRLSEGGQLVIHVKLWGDSFMLHQIRKMIGSAAGVALGTIPMEIVKASLAPPARVNLPMILAETLVLTDLSFFPFPGNVQLNKSPVIDVTGNTLLLRQRGLERQEQFRKEVLNLTLEEQLNSPAWDVWAERLRSLKIRPEEKKQFLAEHQQWEMQQAELKAQKQAREKERKETQQSTADTAQ